MHHVKSRGLSVSVVIHQQCLISAETNATILVGCKC